MKVFSLLALSIQSISFPRYQIISLCLLCCRRPFHMHVHRMLWSNEAWLQEAMRKGDLAQQQETLHKEREAREKKMHSIPFVKMETQELLGLHTSIVAMIPMSKPLITVHYMHSTILCLPATKVSGWPCLLGARDLQGPCGCGY